MTLLSNNALCFGGAAVITLVLTPLAVHIARSVGLVDQPNVRKVHRTPVPRIGGIAICIATLLPLLGLIVYSAGNGLFQPSDLRTVLTLFIGAASLAIVGLLDDILEMSSKYKLAALVAASLTLCGAGGTIQTITFGGIHLLDLQWAAWPVTVLWIVLVTVSINFIDGLDGLAAGIMAIACGVLAIGAGVGGSPVSTILALSLCGALSAFLAYNFHPAKVFMGDCGSMFIGFLFAGTCVIASRDTGSTRGLFLPAITLSVPLMDTMFTMIRRGVLQRRSLFAAERGHVHHRLLDIGLCHVHVVFVLYGVTLSAALVSIIWIFGGYWMTAVMMGIYGCGLIALFRLAGSMRARITISAIRRNRALARENGRYQGAFYDAQLRFREARDFSSWWKQLCHAAEVLDFAKVDLPVLRRDGTESVMRWRRNDELLADASAITAEVPIPQRRSGVTLRAAVEVTVGNFLETAGQRVALFSRLMSEFGVDQIHKSDRTTRNKVPATETDSVTDVLMPDPQAVLPKLRVAIVHDFLYTYAGAERVLEQLVNVFPQSSLFSLFDFLPEHQRGFIQNKAVCASFLQRMPFARKLHRSYLPLMPLAIEQLDVSNFDLVLSSSYMAAKGVITRPDQLHICYCHTPVRFAWDMQNQYLGQVGLTRGLRSIAAKIVLHYIRTWDVRSANGVDAFLTNSDFVGRRVQKVYRRESATVYPPVDTEFFSMHEAKEDFYLTASRMVPYKRIDLIIDAFARMPERRVIVVGHGPDMDRLKAKATPNVTFVGHETAEDLRRHMQLAKAFIFAAEEDFGIAPVEAQACGTPVIAFGRGGVTESVIDGQTGLFFDQQTPEAIIDAIERFEAKTWDPQRIRRQAERFSAENFRTHLAEYVTDAWQRFQSDNRPDPDNAAINIDLPSADVSLNLPGVSN